MLTIQEKANTARGHFTVRDRANGTRSWCAPDSPEWVTDLCRAAHEEANIPPDDYRYAFIVEALDALEAEEEPGKAEVEPSIYTSDLTAWLHSSAFRVYYLSEVLSEGGSGVDGFQALTLAQQREMHEVLDAVRSFLDNLDEEDMVE